MKAQLRLKKLWLEVEAKSQKELFEQIASAEEVFGETSCGLCDSENIKTAVRVQTKGKKCKYYEYHCIDCGARLTLSLNNDDSGTMFVNHELLPNGQPCTGDKRGTGKRGKDRGWTQFKGAVKDDE